MPDQNQTDPNANPVEPASPQAPPPPMPEEIPPITPVVEESATSAEPVLENAQPEENIQPTFMATDSPPPPPILETENPTREEVEGKKEDDNIPAPEKPKKKSKGLVVGLVATLLLIAGLGAGVVLVRQQQDVREKAVSCGGAGATCRLNGDCCSGKCNLTGYSGTCAAPTSTQVQCVSSGGACTSTSQCCGNLSCKGGKCLTEEASTPTKTPTAAACIAIGQRCASGETCCNGGKCVDNKCSLSGTSTPTAQPNCSKEGEFCGIGSANTGPVNCCSGYKCDNGYSIVHATGSTGKCVKDAPSCVPLGKKCATGETCCNNGVCSNNVCIATTPPPTTTLCPKSCVASPKSNCKPGTFYPNESKSLAYGDCGGTGFNEYCCDPIDGAPTKIPTSTTTSTPKPPSGDYCQCLNVIAYDTSWNLLTTDALKNLKAGDKIRFTVKGRASSGKFDKAKFKINGQETAEMTTKKPNTEEFYYEYTIPANVYSFKIDAKIHHDQKGWSN